MPGRAAYDQRVRGLPAQSGKERIEFVKLNIANPAPVPLGPTTVIADNVGFVRPS
jgi:hypothetical protein